MIEALLHGKLSREQENMEDILTSNVFGMLQYVPPQLGLFRFLARATTIAGECPLKFLGGREGNEASVRYEFWPNWPTCQPDVVLRIGLDDLWLVGIEAKFRSGKSSEADEVEERPNDQLAREWICLVAEATKLDAKPVLVYLTADVGCPTSQIRESLDELDRKTTVDAVNPVIYWLSWRELPQLFRDPSTPPMLRAVARMAEDRLGLIFFQGITDVGAIRAEWAFHRSESVWRFDVAPIKSEWRFMQ